GRSGSDTPPFPQPEYFPFSCVEGPPDIAVAPARLSARQPQDVVTVQNLSLCNAGHNPLTWSLSELEQAARLAGWQPDEQPTTYVPEATGEPAGTVARIATRLLSRHDRPGRTADGSASYAGLWAPPIAPLGQTTTGDAYPYTAFRSPALDTGKARPGLPSIEGGVAAADVPWLSADPTSGMVSPGTCADVAMRFDSTDLISGTYPAGLLIQSNDPDEPEVTIPVTLTVLELRGGTLLPLMFRRFAAPVTPSPTPTPLPTPTPTPPPLPTPPFCPLLSNGDFEQGPVVWTQYSQNGRDLILNGGWPGTVTPRSGVWAVWEGGDDNEVCYIQQQAFVPTATPYFRYYHWIASQDACGYDFAYVRVNDTTVDQYSLCSANNTGGWVAHVVNLSAYANQCVTVQIRVETDSSLNSNLFIDDVAFQSTPLGGTVVPLPFDPATALPRSDRR
ncbi:MAG: hypothetical protein ACP5NB_13715, partial [Chloroflexia bacterium]